MPLVPLTVACMMYVAQQENITYRALVGLRHTEGGQVGRATPNYRSGVLSSRDLGPFQVNDRTWVAYFTKIWHEPTEHATFDLLKDNGCANALAAATIFRAMLDDAGGSYGVAVGLYNAPHNPKAAAAYRERYLAVYQKMILNNGTK